MKKEYIQLALIFLFLLLIVVFVQYDRYSVKRNILKNPAYAVATIRHYTAASDRQSRTGSNVFISFTYEGKHIDTDSKVPLENNGRVIESGKDYKGEKFLVIYNKDNPEECILLFNYPIRKETDFDRYMKRFETDPPILE